MTKKHPSDRAVGRQEASRVEVRLSSCTISALDAWRQDQPEQPSRSEAIRRIVEGALAGESAEVLPSPDQLTRVIR